MFAIGADRPPRLHLVKIGTMESTARVHRHRGRVIEITTRVERYIAVPTANIGLFTICRRCTTRTILVRVPRPGGVARDDLNREFVYGQVTDETMLGTTDLATRFATTRSFAPYSTASWASGRRMPRSRCTAKQSDPGNAGTVRTRFGLHRARVRNPARLRASSTLFNQFTGPLLGQQDGKSGWFAALGVEKRRETRTITRVERGEHYSNAAHTKLVDRRARATLRDDDQDRRLAAIVTLGAHDVDL